MLRARVGCTDSMDWAWAWLLAFVVGLTGQTQIPVLSGPVGTTLDVQSRPANPRSISGRVTAEGTSEGVAGLVVGAIQQSYDNEGVLVTTLVTSTTTNQEGLYHIE